MGFVGGEVVLGPVFFSECVGFPFNLSFHRCCAVEIRSVLLNELLLKLCSVKPLGNSQRRLLRQIDNTGRLVWLQIYKHVNISSWGAPENLLLKL